MPTFLPYRTIVAAALQGRKEVNNLETGGEHRRRDRRGWSIDRAVRRFGQRTAIVQGVSNRVYRAPQKLRAKKAADAAQTE